MRFSIGIGELCSPTRQIVVVADGLAEGINDLEKAVHRIESLARRSTAVHHIRPVAVGII